MKNGLVEYADGSKRWYVNGKLHRIDGPAIEHANGSKYWYVSNQLHRIDGPAIDRADGSKQWYVNDQLHRTTKAFQQAAKLTDAEMAALVLKYGDIS